MPPPAYKQQIENFKQKLRELEGVEVLDFSGAKARGENVYLHDISLVHQADFMIAFCDYPSFGLGAEVTHALRLKQIPVYAFAHHNAEVSDFTLDMKCEENLQFDFQRYQEINHVFTIVRQNWNL